MGGLLKRGQDGSKGSKPPATPAPPASAWTDARIEAVLAAWATVVANQARKHGVRPRGVWDLIRDEVLDPDGGPRWGG
jgi:hypothetical protein